MKFKGRFKAAARDWESARINLTFEFVEGNIDELDELKDKDLSVELSRFYEPRSGKANRLLWSCLGEIAKSIKCNKWDVYLDYIKRQNQFSMVQIRPEYLDKLKKQWREVEVVGYPIVDGVQMLDVLCYFGSSTYNTKEFAMLLDDVIDDMKAAGLPLPTSEEMRVALEEIERSSK